MLRSLFNREYGYEVDDLDEVIHDRWSKLQHDNENSIKAPFNLNHYLTNVDLDTTNSSSLLLTGGFKVVDEVTDGNRHNHNHNDIVPTVSLYRKPQPFKKPDSAPLVTSPDNYFNSNSNNNSNNHTSSISKISTLCWYPHDVALFLSGTSVSNNDGDAYISIWDTEEFAIVSNVPLRPLSSDSTSSQKSIFNIACSPHHSAKKELIAVTSSGRSFVTLVDLSSGSTTHRLQSNLSNSIVHDVAWSPTSPHLLASASYDGVISLFDVRRSGTVACLLSMDNRSDKYPNINANFSSKSNHTVASSTAAASRKRRLNNDNKDKKKVKRKNNSKTKDKNLHDDKEEEEFIALGLGCNWRNISNLNHDNYHSRSRRRQQQRRHRHAHHEQFENDKMNMKLEFTPDGSTIVSRKHGKSYLSHDVLTGHLISNFSLPYNNNDNSGTDAHHSTNTFNISPDGLHVMSFIADRLTYVDIMDGRYVNQSLPGPPAYDSVINHYEEQLITVSGSSIDFWSFPQEQEHEQQETE